MAGEGSDETESLLAPPTAVRDSVATRGDAFRRRIRLRFRCPPFFVEPVLILYFFSEFPVDIIGQKYVLDWIAASLREENSTSELHSSPPCAANGSSADVAFQDRVQSLASWFAVVESLAWGLPAIVSTILLGSGSDRLGRRFCVLPSLVGVVASSTTVFFVIWYGASILWLFVGDIVYGLCGSFAAMTMSCFAYVADRTPPHRRMLRIVVVEMCMLLAGVVSPLAVGSVVARIGYAYTVLVVVVSSALNFVYVFIFLPDSDDVDESARSTLSDDSKERDATLYVPESTTERRATAASSSSRSDDVLSGVDDDRVQTVAGFSDVDGDLVATSVNTSPIDAGPRPSFARPGGLGLDGRVSLCDDVHRAAVTLFGAGERRWKVVLLLSAFLISNLPLFDVSVGTLFEMNHPLCWNVNEVGVFTGISTGVSTIGALIAAPLMKLCMPDVAIAICAGLTAVLTNVYKSFVQTSLMMYISEYVDQLRSFHTIAWRKFIILKPCAQQNSSRCFMCCLM